MPVQVPTAPVIVMTPACIDLTSQERAPGQRCGKAEELNAPDPCPVVVPEEQPS